jgi:glycosyltransferase involved in cell wall biosynthesis
VFESPRRRIFQVVNYSPEARGGMETHAGVFAHAFPRASERWAVTTLAPEEISSFVRDAPPPDCVLVEAWHWTDLVPKVRSTWPKAAIVARTGGNDFHYAIAHERRRRTGDWYRMWLEDMRAAVDLVIATSAFSARRLRESELGFLPVAPVRGGAFAVSGCRRDPARRPRIVVVGRLVELKGVDDCVAVAAEVQRSVDAELVVVGDGPLREELEAAAAQALRPGTFTFHGAVAPSVAMALMADSDLLLAMPRPVHDRIGESRVLHVEAMGRGVCEAVVNGIPVVVADVGGVPEMVSPDVGSLVGERDVEAGARAVVDWLERGRPADAAVAQARERFGWPAVFRQYDSLFSAVCRGQAPSLR